MEFRNGDVDPEPLKINGIDFYQIGYNASHVFYMGLKDGKKYRLVYTPGENDKESLKEIEVENWEGYYGHF